VFCLRFLTAASGSGPPARSESAMSESSRARSARGSCPASQGRQTPHRPDPRPDEGGAGGVPRVLAYRARRRSLPRHGAVTDAYDQEHGLAALEEGAPSSGPGHEGAGLPCSPSRAGPGALEGEGGPEAGFRPARTHRLALNDDLHRAPAGGCGRRAGCHLPPGGKS